MYEPTLPRLAVVKSRISVESWEARVEAARRDAAVLGLIAARVDAGATLDEAIRREVPRSRRSWVIRHWGSYRKEGFEGLIDERVPREPRLAKESGPLIEAAREANPKVTVDEVLTILQRQKVQVLPSASTIKTHFARVDGRRRYAKEKERAAGEVIELALAGGELMRAAELETGAIGALTSEVQALAEEAKEASEGLEPELDTAHRDDRGHFTVTYNRKRRRKQGVEIAGYLRTAAEKAEGRVSSWPRFVHERRETLEPKLAMLTYAPLVSGTKGWDALRATEAAGLLPLTGFAYMPSTLAKMTSALAISGAGPRLLEAVGKNWHQVAQQRWEESGAMAALYVDNQVKAVWSSLFTLSGKVSRLNRVMPCITNTFVHTGAGTPLLASVQSGTAPLAPRLVELVKEAEEKLDGDVRRAVVIDAEGSTFDILEAFTKEGRVIVTPLRPSRAPALQLEYSRGSYFRPYRDNDELRTASAVLTHKTTGRSLEVGALLVRREHRESDTILLTTGLLLGMEGRDLADLYFARWPIQENAFKDGAAVGLDQHRGNSGRMVANIAVITELERLESRAQAEEEEQRQLVEAKPGLEEELKRQRSEHQRAVGALATRRGRLDALVAEGRLEGKQFGRAAVEHQEALVRTETSEHAFRVAQEALKQNQERSNELEARLEKMKARRAKLEQQRTIRQLDVELDRVLTATKLTCALLITFVLREYLSAMPMTPHTFATRVFGIRGRRELRPGEEQVVFYENPRDPEVNAALAGACQRLNKRHLTRDGRQLRYKMAAADGGPLD
jgi:hypothetical protein